MPRDSASLRGAPRRQLNDATKKSLRQLFYVGGSATPRQSAFFEWRRHNKTNAGDSRRIWLGPPERHMQQIFGGSIGVICRRNQWHNWYRGGGKTAAPEYTFLIWRVQNMGRSATNHSLRAACFYGKNIRLVAAATQLSACLETPLCSVTRRLHFYLFH